MNAAKRKNSPDLKLSERGSRNSTAESKNNGNAPPSKASESVIKPHQGVVANLIMPQPLVKIKEENMSLWKDMDDLEIAIRDVSQGINAIEAMTLGLLSVKDPYAEGFNALNTYLVEADREVHKCLAACLKAI